MGATKPGAAHWAGPIIPFEIDPGLGDPDRVLPAIRDHWEEQANTRFVRRASQGHFVLFRHGQECRSPSAEQSGMHPVNLKPNASVAAIVHEIGHATGSIHEHRRSDRDTFVNVQPDNILPDKQGKFERFTDSITLTEALALGNALPGPIATKMSLYVGHKEAGTLGALAGMAGFIAPSGALMLVVALCFVRFRETPALQAPDLDDDVGWCVEPSHRFTDGLGVGSLIETVGLHFCLCQR